MLNNRSIGVRLALGFAAVVALTVVLGGVALYNLNGFSNLTQRLFDHPHTVSNSVLAIQGRVRAMERDLLLAKSTVIESDPADIAAEMERRREAVLSDFDIVHERFLGDTTRVEAARAAFVNWSDDVLRALDKMEKRGVGTASQAEAEDLASENLLDNTALDESMRHIVAFARNKADTYMASVEDVQTRVFFFVIGLLILVIAAAAGIALVVTRSLSGPIRALCQSMLRLADNDTDVAVTGTERGDEVGQMAGAVQVFKENAEERQRLAAEQAEEKARQEKRAEALEAAIKTFETSAGQAVQRVADAASTLQATATQLANAVDETGQRSSNVASAAEEANANVQTMASAAEELSSAIDEVARSVNGSAELAKTCTQQADGSRQELDSLQQAIGEVDGIIQSIKDVAEQTNLLALNATIEAARAGEAGKGFAVVANEVKSLASQTDKMTEQITSKVEAVRNSADATINAITGIIEQIKKIDGATNDVAASIEQQSSSTSEISRNAQEAATGTGTVTRNIESVKQAAQQGGEASDSVQNAAKDLTDQAETLRRDINGFLNDVRAA